MPKSFPSRSCAWIYPAARFPPPTIRREYSRLHDRKLPFRVDIPEGRWLLSSADHEELTSSRDQAARPGPRIAVLRQLHGVTSVGVTFSILRYGAAVEDGKVNGHWLRLNVGSSGDCRMGGPAFPEGLQRPGRRCAGVVFDQSHWRCLRGRSRWGARRIGAMKARLRTRRVSRHGIRSRLPSRWSAAAGSMRLSAELGARRTPRRATSARYRRRGRASEIWRFRRGGRGEAQLRPKTTRSGLARCRAR